MIKVETTKGTYFINKFDDLHYEENGFKGQNYWSSLRAYISKNDTLYHIDNLQIYEGHLVSIESTPKSENFKYEGDGPSYA